MDDFLLFPTLALHLKEVIGRFHSIWTWIREDAREDIDPCKVNRSSKSQKSALQKWWRKRKFLIFHILKRSIRIDLTTSRFNHGKQISIEQGPASKLVIFALNYKLRKTSSIAMRLAVHSASRTVHSGSLSRKIRLQIIVTPCSKFQFLFPWKVVSGRLHDTTNEGKLLASLLTDFLGPTGLCLSSSR